MSFRPNNAFEEMSPYSWASIGAALALGLSVCGAAWGIFIVGTAKLGAAIRVPRVRTKNLISIVFCEAMAVYGIIATIVLSRSMGTAPETWARMDYVTGYYIFCAGLLIGITGIACAISIGVLGAGIVMADAENKEIFMRLFIVEIMASALGVFAVIVGLLLGGAGEFGSGRN